MLGNAATPARRSRLFALLSLRQTRAVVRNPRARVLVASIAIVYAVIALFAGYMLELGPTGASGTTVQVLTNSYSPAWWNYPALLIVAPGGVLALPFLATVSMVLVALGVGLGMGAGLLLAVGFFRSWRSVRAGSGSVPSLAGLTPAMVAILTLGACCSTGAAAAGGIGAIADVSGTSYNQLLQNSWYLNVFQVAVLALALIAQEQLITIYGSLAGPTQRTTSTAPGSASSTPRAVVRGPVLALRLFLVIAGTLWALSLLIEVAAPSTAAPVAGLVVGGLLQHGLVGVTAVAAGLLPTILTGAFLKRTANRFDRAYRALLLVCGASVVMVVPPPLDSWGIYGLGNEILGAAGVPASFGGVLVPGGSGVGIGLAVAAVYAVLGIFVMVLALVPRSVLRRLVGRMEESIHPSEERSLASRQIEHSVSDLRSPVREDLW
ncbi:MAG: hypothetical protein WAN74_06450 [Thermoplasmata archaeon]